MCARTYIWKTGVHTILKLSTNMFEPSAVLSSLKETTPIILGGVAIACGSILFSGNSFTEGLGLAEFRDLNRAGLGWAFVLSVSILCSHLVFQAFKLTKSLWIASQKKRKSNVLRAHKIAELSKLTPDEKGYLQPFIQAKVTSQKFPLDDGIRGSLEAKGIIYQASNMGNLVDGWAYNLQPWAKEHLEANPRLLDGGILRKRRSNW